MHCNICGNSNFEIIGEKRFSGIQTRSATLEFLVRLVCCRRCGLVFQNPLQAENKLHQYYESMYREEGCRPRSYIEEQFRPRADFLSRFRIPGVNQLLLEVGCADGTTLLDFQSRGFSVFGIEPSRENADLCKSKGLELFNGNYHDFDLGPQRFDFVCSYYVIEHLTSPVHFLSFCNRALNMNGILCVEVPDIGAYQLERTTSDLLFFYEHQYHFSKETVEILLRWCGFKLLAFADEATESFGMHIAAKKASALGSIEDLQVPPGVFDRVMAEINAYKAEFVTKLAAMEDGIRGLLSQYNERRKRVVLFGAGNYARMLLSLPDIDTSSIEFIADNNPGKWGTYLRGIPVCPPSMLDSSIDTVVVTSGFGEEIQEQLQQMGVSKEKIVIL